MILCLREGLQVKTELKGQTLAGLINNAGVANHAVLMHLPIDEFRKVLEINLVGTLAVIQASQFRHTCTAVAFAWHFWDHHIQAANKSLPMRCNFFTHAEPIPVHVIHWRGGLMVRRLEAPIEM